MPDNSRQRVAIITGATGGIGSAIAKEIYGQGARLVLTGRKKDKLHDIQKSLTTTDKDALSHVHCIPLDLEQPNSDKILIDETLNKFGRIDILVNTAAKMDSRLFLRTDDEFMKKMILVNFLVPMRLMQQAIKSMSKNKYGRIVNITSLASSMGNTGMSAYSATKGALTSLSKTVANEYASRGITINCVAPGLIDTQALQMVPDSHRQFIKQQIPAKRFGLPEEIAAIVGQLTSEKASYITGQVIHVNGGLYR